MTLHTRHRSASPAATASQRARRRLDLGTRTMLLISIMVVALGSVIPLAAVLAAAYLSGIERSPNTVKAYAHDLKDYFVFLDHRGLDWREVRLEDLGEFVSWLRLPPAGRSGKVAVLPSVQPRVGSATINRKLSAVSAFINTMPATVSMLVICWSCGSLAGVVRSSRFCTTIRPILHQNGWNSKPATKRFATGAALMASIPPDDSPD